MLSDYRIFETDQFQSDIQSRLGSHHLKIVAKLRDQVYPQLRNEPHFGRQIKKLKSYRPDTWRYRIGGYRFFYEIDDSRKIVFMLAADSRQSSY